jgi:hypothetical protein
MEHKTKTYFFILLITLAALACSLAGSEQGGNQLNGDQLAMRATEQAIQMTQTALASGAVPDVQPDLPESEAPLPTEPPVVPDGEPVEEKARSGLLGVMLAYNDSIYGELISNYVEAAQDAPYQVAHPRHVEFLHGDGQGVISVVPVHSYALVYDETEQLIAALQNDLSYSLMFGTNCINELPIREFYHQCSHQEFVASPAKLNFVGGSGVRFVTVYAIQDFAPVDNANLRYIFQGLKNDGQCYLSAEFTLTHTSLPPNGEIPMDVYTSTSGEESAIYFGELAEQLTLDEGGYSPSLTVLDQLIESLEVIQCGVNQ